MYKVTFGTAADYSHSPSLSSSREQEQHRRRRQRTNGEVVRGRKHSRSVFLATARPSVGGWGIWVKCFSLPFFIAAFNSDLAERTGARMDTEPAGGRMARKRRQVTRNHNVFCFSHLNRLLSHHRPHSLPPSLTHLGRNKSAVGRERRCECEKGETLCASL